MSHLKEFIRGRSESPQLQVVASGSTAHLSSHDHSELNIASTPGSPAITSSPRKSRRKKVKDFFLKPFQPSSSVPGHDTPGPSPQIQGTSNSNLTLTSLPDISRPSSTNGPPTPPARLLAVSPSPEPPSNLHEESLHTLPSINPIQQISDGTKAESMQEQSEGSGIIDVPLDHLSTLSGLGVLRRSVGKEESSNPVVTAATPHSPPSPSPLPEETTSTFTHSATPPSVEPPPSFREQSNTASPDPHPVPSGVESATAEEEPAPSSAHELPTINPTTEGTGETQSEETPKKNSRVKNAFKTASNAAKQILDIATESSDAFAPLKSVLGGIRSFVNYSEQYSDNKSRIAKLGSRVDSLESVMLVQINEPSEAQRRNALQLKLGRISEEVNRIARQSLAEKISNIKHDEGAIAGCLEDLSDALTDYQASIQQHILELGIRMIEDVHLLLLKELAHAKDAGYTAGNRQKCLRGTRRDLLDKIYAWARDPTNRHIYWLNGSAGTGKSTICQSFAEWCFAQGLLGASFFCSRDFNDRNTLGLIFPTLALDLAYKYPAFRADLLKIIRSTPNLGSQSLSLQLENFLIRPLTSSGISTIIVIDALDECEDNSPASTILSMLGKHIDKLDKVKPHTEVFQLHSVEPESVDNDIQLYFKTQLASLVEIRSDVEFPAPWPEGSTIAVLVRKAGGLFIFASTTYKYVAYARGDPLEPLQQVLDDPGSSSFEGHAGLDSLYTRILTDNYSSTYGSAKATERLKPILGAVVVVYNPQSRTVLAKLLGLLSADIRKALQFIHSLLHVPESEHGPIRAYHKSFHDYLVDAERCSNPQLHVDPAVHHEHLAIGCLELMNGTLKRNICELPRYSLNKDVKDISERRQKHIGEALEYACMFWAQHLKESFKSGRDVEKITKLMEDFLRQHCLSWLEVLSITGSLQTAVYSLRDARAWFSQVDTRGMKLVESLEDVERFTLSFFDVINVSASHIYDSAVPLSPKKSIIHRQHYDKEMPQSWYAMDDSWDACIRKIDIEQGKCVVFSHKGDRVAACGGNWPSFLGIIEVATGLVLSTFSGHWSTILSVAFSPDDSLLVSGSEHTVTLWDIQTGGLVKTLHLETKMRSVAFSHDGSMIACDAGIWDSLLESVVRKFDAGVTSWSCSPIKAEITLGYNAGVLKKLDVADGEFQELGSKHRSYISSIAYSRDGARTVSGSGGDTGEIKIHDANTGEFLQGFPMRYPESVCFSRDGERLVFVQFFDLVLCDLKNWNDVIKITQPGPPCYASVSPDGTSIALADNAKLSIWQMNGLTRSSETTSRHSGEVNSVAISPDSSFIASCSDDHTVKLWDLATGICLHTFKDDSSLVLDVAISPDSSLVASGSMDCKIRVWRVADRTLVCTLEGHSDWVIGVAFSPDGKQIASVSNDGAARLWDIGEEKTIGKLEKIGFRGYRSKIRFSSDGAGINVSDYDNSRSWKIVSSIESSSLGPDQLPISFTPHDSPSDIQSPTSHDHSPEWITNQDGVRLLWLPHDLRGANCGHSNGSNLVMGFRTGRVFWVSESPAKT